MERSQIDIARSSCLRSVFSSKFTRQQENAGCLIDCSFVHVACTCHANYYVPVITRNVSGLRYAARGPEYVRGSPKLADRAATDPWKLISKRRQFSVHAK